MAAGEAVLAEDELEERARIAEAQGEVAEEASELGVTFSRFCDSLEGFYCAAYQIPPDQRRAFCGRGRGGQTRQRQ